MTHVDMRWLGGPNPERFGLHQGQAVKYTKQGLELFGHSQKYGYIVSFQDNCAWIQWMDGSRELLGCAWLELHDGPMDGETTTDTIESIFGSEEIPKA